MKHWKCILVLALVLCLLSGCGHAPAETAAAPAGTAVRTLEEEPASGGGENPGEGGKPAPSLAEDEEPAVLLCRIVDGAEDGNLLLAELDGGLYGGTGVYRLNVENIPVTLDGAAAEPAVLEDGMPVEVSFNGGVLESFPAQFGEVYGVSAWSRGQGRNGTGTAYDLCGLYLQVLDDLWNKDLGLNEDISIAGLDLSRAPGGLTESETSALAWRFGELHGVEVVTGTFQELKEQGYFQEKTVQHTDGAQQKETVAGPAFYEWEDGCLFSIESNEEHEGETYSLPVLFFNAEKWRSPLGAYCFYDCSAGWGEATAWNGYSVGSEMIS